MLCPKCGSKTRVIDNSKAPTETYRHRRCNVCEHEFFTIEYEVECTGKFMSIYYEHHRVYQRLRNRKENS